MEIFLIVIVVICIIAAIIKAVSSSDDTSQIVNANLTDEQKQWLQKVGEIFRENKALTFLDVYVECGMPMDIAYSKDSDAITRAFPFNKEETKHDGYDSEFGCVEDGLNEFVIVLDRIISGTETQNLSK